MEIEGLRTLVRYRKTLVKDINRYKNRTKSLLYYYGIQIPFDLENPSKIWSKRFTSWLKELQLNTEHANYTLKNIIDIVEDLRIKLLAVNRQLRKIEKDSQHAHKIKLVRSVPGIGSVTAWTVITELNDIQRFKKFDRLCSYAGFVPSTHSSGEKDVVGKITPRSNRQLRTMLIESAWIAIRQDPALMMKYQQLRQRMDSNKAIVRIAKKLLSRIRYVLLNNEPYERGRVQ